MQTLLLSESTQNIVFLVCGAISFQCFMHGITLPTTGKEAQENEDYVTLSFLVLITSILGTLLNATKGVV